MNFPFQSSLVAGSGQKYGHHTPSTEFCHVIITHRVSTKVTFRVFQDQKVAGIGTGLNLFVVKADEITVPIRFRDVQNMMNFD